jgi:two-component system response regulator AtoC
MCEALLLANDPHREGGSVNEGRVLLVGVDGFRQRQTAHAVRDLGYEPALARSVDEAIAVFREDRFAFTLLDVDPGGVREFYARLDAQGADPGAVIVLCDWNGHSEDKEAPIRAEEILHRPFSPLDLENAIRSVVTLPKRPGGPLADEEARLRREISLGCSPEMQEVWEIVRQAAGADVTVLICGETGTGKDLVARSIHHLSSRRNQPFVKVNCAAVPRELLESELFGHERGAFTGAHQLKIGKFENANHGTVFLDEIGDLHPALQAKLLHVLQDGTFSRVGGKSTIKVNVRVLAATNQDLERAVAAERFRQDLYYRLNVIQVVVPPLRERLEEVALLASYFVDRYSVMYNRHGFQLSPATIDRLVRYSYPGNVRELENIIKRLIVLNDPLMKRTVLPAAAEGTQSETAAERPPVAEVVSLKDIARTAARAAEREAIARVLKQTSWNRVRAARILKISYRALLYKIKYAGLDRAAARPGH